MNYNKSSTKRKMKRVDSKGTKIKNKIILTLLKTIMVFVIVVAVIGVGAGLGVAKGIIDSAPDISRLDVVPTGYSTTVLSSDGEEIAKLVGSGANREYVTLDQVPVHMQHAFVAIEDERFYEHNGIDLQGLQASLVYSSYEQPTRAPPRKISTLHCIPPKRFLGHTH